MPRLTPEHVHTLQALLSQRETTLQEEVRAAKEADAERPSASGPQVDDEVAGGQDHLMRGIQHVELLRDQEELQDIQNARDRMAAGTYGECTECGKNIPFERLQVQPAAARCIACQETYERTHDPMPRYAT